MFKVIRDGKELDRSLYTLDESTRTFSTNENGLLIECDHSWTLKTGISCIFHTNDYCTFNTGSFCTFNTTSNCIFRVSQECVFKTGSNCTFDTGRNCTFDTKFNCVFKTGYNCMFKIEEGCVIIYLHREKLKNERYLPDEGLYVVKESSIYVPEKLEKLQILKTLKRLETI